MGLAWKIVGSTNQVKSNKIEDYATEAIGNTRFGSHSKLGVSGRILILLIETSVH